MFDILNDFIYIHVYNCSINVVLCGHMNEYADKHNQTSILTFFTICFVVEFVIQCWNLYPCLFRFC